MKTKNQTGHSVLELALAKAANEDGIAPAGTRDTGARKQAWSPLEVWRTRVKDKAALKRPDSAQV